MCINEEKNKNEKLKKLLPSIKIIYMIFIKNKQRRFKIMPMKKRLSSSIGAIIVLCAIIIISLQKYQPDQEIITTFMHEWLNDDSKAETEYKRILEAGSDNQALSQPLQKYFITEESFQSFLKTFYYLPVKILQQYDSYNLTELNVTKESNGYLVKVDLELIKEEKSKNHSITIKIQMDHKKFTYFTITEGKEI